MPRAADTLHARRHRRRRLDLDHEVDGPHVDPQLERRRGDDGGQAPCLQRILDRDALLAGDRAMMGAHQLLSRQVVQGRGQPLGQPPAVHEDERRAMGPDELQQPRMDRGPDRAASDRPRHPLDNLARGKRLAQPGHVLHRDLDLEIERLALPRIHDGDRPGTPRPRPFAAPEVARDLLEGTLRGGEPHPLRRLPGRLGQALEREGEVGAALGPDEGVDLVHDHQLDRGQHFPGP
jgi:hypothetical protein